MNEIFLSIIEKVKDIKRLGSDAQVAKTLGMSRNNLYQFKRSKNLPLKQIHNFCSREGVRVDYLLHGTLPIYDTETRMVAEHNAPYIRAGTASEQSGIGTLIDQTIEVLKSNTKYGTALKENIEAFHMAVTNDKPTTDNESKKESDPSRAAGGSSPAAKKKAAQ